MDYETGMSKPRGIHRVSRFIQGPGFTTRSMEKTVITRSDSVDSAKEARVNARWQELTATGRFPTRPEIQTLPCSVVQSPAV